MYTEVKTQAQKPELEDHFRQYFHSLSLCSASLTPFNKLKEGTGASLCYCPVLTEGTGASLCYCPVLTEGGHIITVMDISKDHTRRLKAMNKHTITITHVMYIAVETYNYLKR